MQLVARVQMKMAPATVLYTKLGHACRKMDTGTATAEDRVTKVTTVMMVGD